MKTILSPDIIAEKALGKQPINTSCEYRLLNFVLQKKVDNGVLLHNFLTKELLFLENDEFSYIDVSDFKQEIYIILINKWFLVPKDHDDIKLNDQLCNFAATFMKLETKKYTILPTLDCNARCFYCFEYGANREKMTVETADAVVKYIQKNCRNNIVSIRWFGGEPLYNIEIIDYICSQLLSKDIKVYSKMVSNGYLFDDNVVFKAKSLWNLNHVQITLDGTEEIYNKTKAYIYKSDKNPFARVINNIELLLKNDINVVIRINFDRHNINDIYKLIEFIEYRFSGYKKLHVYPAPLFDDKDVLRKTRTDDEQNYLLEELSNMNSILYKKGFYKISPMRFVKRCGCGADDVNRDVILPNGNLGRCERYTEESRLGNVWNSKGNIDLIKSWRERIPRFDMCNNCVILPECVILSKCPSMNSHGCTSLSRTIRVKEQEYAIFNEYEKYLARENNGTKN